ncbi:hypothetical protein Q670_07780 [Alcanivorax sp. P2S70]|nr:hypothetical protein Q670_07780 [Alcanivorax sp. P2S70]
MPFIPRGVLDLGQETIWLLFPLGEMQIQDKRVEQGTKGSPLPKHNDPPATPIEPLFLNFFFYLVRKRAITGIHKI